MAENYLSVSEVAEKLNVHINTVRRYIQNGELKAYQFGRIKRGKWWHVLPTDLETFVNGNK